jgi:hypothetical protein
VRSSKRSDHDNQPGIYFRDLFPSNWPDHDSRLLADMVQAAWVFGGMGSWNDLWPPDGTQEEYEHLTTELFGAVMLALVAAASVDVDR